MEKPTAVFCYSNDNRLVAEDLSTATFVIRMLSGGFCLAILSKGGNVLSLKQYTFSPNLSFAGKMDAVIDAREGVHLQCAKAVFQLYTSINTQIPEEFYEEKLNVAIADLLVRKSENYVPFEEKIADSPLYNLSLWNDALLKKVKKRFPNYELKTVAGSLLAKIAQRKPQDESIVFVEDNNFTILARNAKGLLGCNCFVFDTEADFLYYCLSFLRNCYQNPENIPLALCGNITAQSPLFVSLKKYIAKLELIDSEEHNIANAHFYYDII